VYVLLFSEIIVKALLDTSRDGTTPVGAWAWEDRLSKVTPKQAAHYRASFFKNLSAAAAGGA